MKFYIILLTVALSLFGGDINPKPFKAIPTLAPSHIKITKAYDHGNIYELELEISTPRGIQHTTTYVTKDKKVLLFGDAIDAATGESIKRPINMAPIRKNADIIYGSGKDEYFVFTDPECPYCVRFEKTWPSIAKKVKLYVYFMPLSNHKNAVQMSYYIMSKKNQYDKVNAVFDMINGDKSYKKFNLKQKLAKTYAKKLNKNRELANKFGVQGTPSVFNTKGQAVMWNTLGR